MSGLRVHAASRGDFYTSHEGLHLLFRAGADSLHRAAKEMVQPVDPHAVDRYAHREPRRRAHRVFPRHLPIPSASRSALRWASNGCSELVQVLNPQNQPGRLTFIHRFGIKDIEQRLPEMIEAVRATGSQVLWVCDPMHGNTETTAGGIKTRRFDNILGEVEAAFRIHEELGSMLGGVHIELTGEDVTECIGGARGLAEADLARAYKSPVDPRLNAEQALELAMLIARRAGARRVRTQ